MYKQVNKIFNWIIHAEWITKLFLYHPLLKQWSLKSELMYIPWLTLSTICTLISHNYYLNLIALYACHLFFTLSFFSLFLNKSLYSEKENNLQLSMHCSYIYVIEYALELRVHPQIPCSSITMKTPRSPSSGIWILFFTSLGSYHIRSFCFGRFRNPVLATFSYWYDFITILKDL